MTSPSLASEAERLAALAALAIGQEPTTGAARPAPVVRTGRELYAGGTVRRLLVLPTSLTYSDRPGVLEYAPATPGDVVLVTEEQAARLDSLEATVDPDADLEELADAGVSDEQLAALGAAQLVAYVAQHPEERERVRTLELARTGSGKGRGPRATVLAATEPTPAEDDHADGVADEREAVRLELEAAARHDVDDTLVAGTRLEADPTVSVPPPVLPAQTIGATAPPVITPPED